MNQLHPALEISNIRPLDPTYSCLLKDILLENLSFLFCIYMYLSLKDHAHQHINMLLFLIA